MTHAELSPSGTPDFSGYLDRQIHDEFTAHRGITYRVLTLAVLRSGHVPVKPYAANFQSWSNRPDQLKALQEGINTVSGWVLVARGLTGDVISDPPVNLHGQRTFTQQESDTILNALSAMTLEESTDRASGKMTASLRSQRMRNLYGVTAASLEQARNIVRTLR